MDELIKDTGFNPSLFHNDHDVYSLYKKTEAVSGAIFLITNLVPESDIIKDTLRRQCLVALTHAVSLMAPTVNVTAIQSISADMLHLNSLLDIAFWSGAVSQMNSSVIQTQISKIQLIAASLIDKYKNRFFLDQTFFDKTYSPPAPQPQAYKGQTKGHDKRQYIKDTHIPLHSNSERRGAILKLLGQKGDLSIKDFASVISGYSEKTIQRELLALVDEGVVKKQGERRWSTYSLKA